MKFFSDVGMAILVSTLCGCVSMQQRVAQMRPAATQVAQKRGAFELACPAASAVVLSDEMLQAGAAGPLLRSPERAEYTLGVSGCGQRAAYLVVCTVGGTGCVAGGTRNITR
jgi:hypothetical protein